MTIAEHLSATRRLSWVDRKFHLQKLQQTVPGFDITAIQKIYLLGYAEASKQVLLSIIEYVRTNSVCGLKRIFNSLPYGEDELGLTVVGNMFSVYLLLPNSGVSTLYVIDTMNQKAEFSGEASGLVYSFLIGKRIVYPPLSLLT